MALGDNIQAYWKFDESSGNASDSVNGNTLTNNGTITYSAAKINNGANLGTSKYFSCGDSASLSPTSDFSVSWWWKLNSITSLMVPFSKWTASGNQRSFESYYTAGNMRFGMSTTGSNEVIFGDFSWTASTATWYHLVLTRNGSTGDSKFYVNGSQQDSTKNAATTNIYDSTGTLMIGQYDSGDGRWTDGLIDEMGMWTRVLSSTDVTDLYNGGSGNQYPFSGGATVNSAFLGFMR